MEEQQALNEVVGCVGVQVAALVRGVPILGTHLVLGCAEAPAEVGEHAACMHAPWGVMCLLLGSVAHNIAAARASTLVLSTPLWRVSRCMYCKSPRMHSAAQCVPS